MFESPQKRRRRRIVIPVLVTIIVAIVAVASTSGGDARATISYLEDIRTAAADLSRSGNALSDLVADLSRVERTEFESAVGLVEEALAAAAEVDVGDNPDPSLVGAGTLYRLAIQQWTEGIDGFSDSLLRAADDPTDQTAVDDLSTAVVQVRAGDRIYDALVEELGRDDVPAPVGPMPDVRLLPVDTPVTILAPAWVEAARSTTSGLALRPSVRIEQVSASPEWVTSADGVTVVPAPLEDEMIDITVVVGNAGNTPSDPAELNLTMESGDGEPTEQVEEVPVIDAASTTSVVFTDLEVTFGTTYDLALTLVPGGTDVIGDDNERSMRFTVNEAPTEE